MIRPRLVYTACGSGDAWDRAHCARRPHRHQATHDYLYDACLGGAKGAATGARSAGWQNMHLLHVQGSSPCRATL
jgi:hypothetical protein